MCLPCHHSGVLRTETQGVSILALSAHFVYLLREQQILPQFFAGQISERIPESVQMSLQASSGYGGQPWRYEQVRSLRYQITKRASDIQYAHPYLTNTNVN